MRNDKTLHVLYQANRTYEVAMVVSICSLLESIRDIQRVVLHITDDDLSKECIDRVNSLVLLFDTSVEVDWINGASLGERLEKLGVIKHRGSYTTYMKLLVVDMIIDNYPTMNMLLYLDSDTLIRREPNSLFNLDMSEYDVFAAYEYTHYAYRRHLGILGNSVNAGVILVNTDRWKENHDGERVVNALKDENYTKRLWLHDQDILNQLFEKDMGILPPEYNVNHSLYLCSNKDKYVKRFRMSENFYEQEAIDNAISDPIVIHYMDDCWTGMPWDGWNANRWCREFDELKRRYWESGEIRINKPRYRVMGKAVIVSFMKILPKCFAAEFYFLVSKMVNDIHLV